MNEKNTQFVNMEPDMGLEAGAYKRTALLKIGSIIRARAPSTKGKQSQAK